MGFLKKIQKFLNEVVAELKKVTWPSFRETSVMTGVVLFAVVAVTVLFWVLDTIFAGALEYIIG